MSQASSRCSLRFKFSRRIKSLFIFSVLTRFSIIFNFYRKFKSLFIFSALTRFSFNLKFFPSNQKFVYFQRFDEFFSNPVFYKVSFCITGSVPIEATVEIANDPNIRTYQNQTAEDIESGRARMDSVTSYGSGGSEEALLPEVRITHSSPRRGGGNRENLPLLRGSRLQDYEDIDVESVNVFPG